MGYLAYGHPFLDGNGRTIMVVHAELAERAGISIDWSATSKVAYLNALTQEIERPGAGHLDAYLKPFLRQPVGVERLAEHVVNTRGLDGRTETVEKIGFLERSPIRSCGPDRTKIARQVNEDPDP